MKLTHGRVISVMLLLTILVSSLILLTEKAIQFVYLFKYLLRNPVKNINESMNEENEELDRLKSQMDTMNESSITSRISDFSKKRSDIEHNLRKIQFFRSYPKYIKLEKLYFFTYMEEAENLYEKCIKYLKRDIYNTTICSFAKAVTSNDEGELGDILRRIEKHVLPRAESLPYGNFFSPIRNAYMEREARGCRRDLSQQMIYEMYELLIRNEEIAYLLYKLSYSILTKCSQGINSGIHSSESANHEETSFSSENYTDEMESALEVIIRQIQNYKKLILVVIADLPREELCENSPVLLDNEFFNIKRVVEPMSDECRSTCDDFSERTISGMTLYSKDNINITSCDTCISVNSSQFPREPTCFSNVTSKSNASSHALYRICVVPSFLNSTLGEEEEMYTHIHDHHRSGWVCKCTNPDVNIKYPYAISLRPQESDIAENMIVTGIRFHKTENPDGIEVIYPQIKVAKLSPKGLSEGVWKDVGNFDNGPWPSGEAGVDYAIFGSDENRSMIITSTINRGKSGHVVTGVKFELRYNRYREKRYEGDVEKSFEIVVRMTPCNFTTGHLSASESIYTDPDIAMASSVNNNIELKMPIRVDVGKNHKELLMNGEDVTPDPEILKYVRIPRLTESISYERRTTSYFDISSVESTPALPLFAIDLFIRKVFWEIELLAFKVRTVNLAEMMEWQRYENLSLI